MELIPCNESWLSSVHQAVRAPNEGMHQDPVFASERDGACPARKALLTERHCTNKTGRSMR